MAVLRQEHCGQPEPHPPHNGEARTGLHTSVVHCDGNPDTLMRQREREELPRPPGPPVDPPRRLTW